MNKLINKINIKKYSSGILAVAAVASLAVGFSAFAQASPTALSQNGQAPAGWMNHAGGGMRVPGIMGTVSAISGDTLTVTGKQGFGSTATTTTFTVDATNAKITKSGTTGSISSIAVGDTVMVRGTVSGTSVTATAIMDGLPQANGIGGKVTAISGSTITITGRNNTTYTINAGSATVTKNNAASSVSSIAVGDMIFAQGTVNGTTVTATTIRDGFMQGPGKSGAPSSTTMPIIGNGEPVVAGTVSAISGSTITITNKSNVTYTVDASGAKFLNGQNTEALSNVAVGDSVVIQGTINGNAIVASTVIDQTHSASGSSTSSQPKGGRGFFGGIKEFFSRLGF